MSQLPPGLSLSSCATLNDERAVRISIEARLKHFGPTVTAEVVLPVRDARAFFLRGLQQCDLAEFGPEPERDKRQLRLVEPDTIEDDGA